VHEAALQRWLVDGVPTPRQPRIAMDPGPPLRTATYGGAAMGTGRLPLFGAATPFTDDELLARYTSRAEYEQGWNDAVDTLLTSGSLRPEAVPAMLERVAEARLPF
jgi:hypothetical protein